MAINSRDGRYALELWLNPDSEDDPDDNEFSDNLEELKERARVLLRAGRFKFIAVCEYNYSTQEWDDLWELPEQLESMNRR